MVGVPPQWAGAQGFAGLAPVTARLLSCVPMSSLYELGRADNWWDSKIPPVLALCYATALIYDVPLAASVRSLALIVFVGLCAGSYGHIVNDAFDIEADRKSGKPNRMAGFAPWQRFAFCALALGLGFAPAIFFPYSGMSLALLAVEYLLPSVYSIPPLRLKERGALGVLCDSMGAHAVPCLYAISVMANEAAKPAGRFAWLAPALAATGFVWALCLGVKGIIIHEFQDRAGDLQAGVSTLATGLDFQAVRLLVNRVYAVELCGFLGVALALFPVAPLLPVVAAAYAATVWVKVARHWDFFVYGRSPNATIQWWQFSHPFYEFYFPLFLAVELAWRHPWLAFLPVVQVLAFRNNFRRRFGELRAFVRQEFDDFGLDGIECFQQVEGFVQLDRVDAAVREGAEGLIEDDGFELAAALFRSAVAGISDNQAAHHSRGKGIKLDAVAPVVPGVDGELEKCLVDEDGGADRAARLAPEMVLGKVPEFFVDELKELIRNGLISRTPRAQQRRHVAWPHGWTIIAVDSRRNRAGIFQVPVPDRNLAIIRYTVSAWGFNAA